MPTTSSNLHRRYPTLRCFHQALNPQHNVTQIPRLHKELQSEQWYGISINYIFIPVTRRSLTFPGHKIPAVGLGTWLGISSLPYPLIIPIHRPPRFRSQSPGKWLSPNRHRPILRHRTHHRIRNPRLRYPPLRNNCRH
jgi:hypothetical protein